MRGFQNSKNFSDPMIFGRDISSRVVLVNAPRDHDGFAFAKNVFLMHFLFPSNLFWPEDSKTVKIFEIGRGLAELQGLNSDPGCRGFRRYTRFFQRYFGITE